MDRSRNIVPLIATLAFAGLFAVACDSGTQEPAAPTEAEPTTSTHSDDAGSMPNQDEIDEKIAAIPESRFMKDLPEGVEAAVPDSFPKDLPIYPGSAPAQGKAAELDGSPMAAVQFLTVDPPEEVYGYYLENLEGEGWILEERPELSGKNAISASKGECRAMILIAPSEDGGSDIAVVSEC